MKNNVNLFFQSENLSMLLLKCNIFGFNVRWVVHLWQDLLVFAHFFIKEDFVYFDKVSSITRIDRENLKQKDECGVFTKTCSSQ